MVIVLVMSAVFKRNERDWAGQLISWIQEAIRDGKTIFQDATNDSGVIMESGRTKFPDVLLFLDKVSGVVFNGWELKFPDTPVDDVEMLRNALEKAKKLQSCSFVTWNGSNAVIWRINAESYSLDSLSKIKEYPQESTITRRSDLADPFSFRKNEVLLKKRALEILHDLGQYYRTGALRPAINISGNVIEAIKASANIIIPQFKEAIISRKGEDAEFRRQYHQWRIYESFSLSKSSSRYDENIDEDEILAKITLYNLIGKIIFYLTLCENLNGKLDDITIKDASQTKFILTSYFNQAKAIDYQAVFMPHFTDDIDYSDVVNNTLYQLVLRLTEFDFRILPDSVIGNILENLVPKEEKQKFGQYYTPDILAYLVAFPVVQTKHDFLFDPTSGTGTFLDVFYKILNFYCQANQVNHADLLSQIWGNDVSHFPALLSVINLYKQNMVGTNNFPRVMRKDFFSISVGNKLSFPDSQDCHKHIELPIP